MKEAYKYVITASLLAVVVLELYSIDRIRTLSEQTRSVRGCTIAATIHNGDKPGLLYVIRIPAAGTPNLELFLVDPADPGKLTKVNFIAQFDDALDGFVLEGVIGGEAAFKSVVKVFLSETGITVRINDTIPDELSINY